MLSYPWMTRFRTSVRLTSSGNSTARSGRSRSARFAASPITDSFQYTCDVNASLQSNESKSIPLRNATIASLASTMSRNRSAKSRVIHQLPRGINGHAETRSFDRRGGHDIYRASEQRLQRPAKIQISASVVRFRVDVREGRNKIKIAGGLIEPWSRRRPKELKHCHTVFPAKCFNIRQMLLDFRVHMVIIPDGGEIASPSVGFRAVNSPANQNWSVCD